MQGGVLVVLMLCVGAVCSQPNRGPAGAQGTMATSATGPSEPPGPPGPSGPPNTEGFFVPAQMPPLRPELPLLPYAPPTPNGKYPECYYTDTSHLASYSYNQDSRYPASYYQVVNRVIHTIKKMFHFQIFFFKIKTT